MRIVLTMPTRPAAPRRRGIWTGLGTLTLLAAALGATTGYFVRVDMPDLRGLEDYAPAEMTRLLARDGSQIASFATEKRIVLGAHDIPESFRRALIAAEDSRFADHAGIDPIGGMRALWNDVRRRRFAQGASTLTMQLAGNLFLDRSARTVRRKLQEAFLAMEIERRFSKPEILRMYCNQVYFGHGLYGLEAAARYYFGKTARALTTGESATLVGLLPRPASYSPFRDMERAVERRNLVLRRMVAEGYLSPLEADRLADEPIVLARRSGTRELAPHFTEGVRRRLHESYGSSSLYRGGLRVRTTLDPRLQENAEAAVETGLRRLDKRQGWRREAIRRVPRDSNPRDWESPVWAEGIAVGRVTDGVVLDVAAEGATVRIGERTGTLTGAAIRWTGERRPDRLLRAGDVVRVRVLELRGGEAMRLALEQEPEVEGALLAIDPATGEVLAMVGGFDFARSEYDRATSARRQTGSLFKPFVYATAFASGWTLADTLVDEPTVFLDPRKPVPYQPENFSRRYYETVTLRTALEKSANIATVKLLERIGCEPVIDTARRLGVRSRLRPFPSLALGAFELTLLEVTSAYGAFANQGLLMEPYWIEEAVDRAGRTIHRARPRVTEAVSPQVAYLMNRALTGVIRHGTGHAAGEVLDHTLAGKTGTTDDYTDAWFVGYSPRLVVGVWVGYDEPRSLGESETGGRAALPIWIEFMRRALEDVGDQPFPVPPGIATAPVDPRTGKRPSVEAGCDDYIVEVFVEGTEPSDLCSWERHERLRLPYPFQAYPLDVDGSLEIPRNELACLLEQEQDVILDHPSEMLLGFAREGTARLAVTELADNDGWTERLPGRLREESASWVGTDGRRARVVWFGDRPGREPEGGLSTVSGLQPAAEERAAETGRGQSPVAAPISAGTARAGSLMMKSVPLPTSDSTEISPRWSSMMPKLTESPSPVP
jgi:penicillin-binding protein 1A